MKEEYKAILNMPHHVSTRRHPMSLHDRAAQFSPFAALTGFDEQIDETARLTGFRSELTEDEICLLNKNFQELINMEAERPEVKIIYFKADEKKSGGIYTSHTGFFRFYDEAEKKLKFTDGTELDAENIVSIHIKPSEEK